MGRLPTHAGVVAGPFDNLSIFFRISFRARGDPSRVEPVRRFRRDRLQPVGLVAAGIFLLVAAVFAGGLLPQDFAWIVPTAGFAGFVLCLRRAMVLWRVDDSVFDHPGARAGEVHPQPVPIARSPSRFRFDRTGPSGAVKSRSWAVACFGKERNRMNSPGNKLSCALLLAVGAAAARAADPPAGPPPTDAAAVASFEPSARKRLLLERIESLERRIAVLESGYARETARALGLPGLNRASLSPAHAEAPEPRSTPAAPEQTRASASSLSQAEKPTKPEPFAFTDFTWLTGNSREKESPLESKVVSGEVRIDVDYVYDFIPRITRSQDRARSSDRARFTDADRRWRRPPLEQRSGAVDDCRDAMGVGGAGW